MTVRISEKPVVAQDAADKVDPGQSRQVHAGVFNPRQMITALPGAVRKLDPRHLARNPVMFVVFVGSVITTVMAIADPSVFSWVITLWLWFTVIFANLAESVAEGRGKAQAASLRKVKQDTTAHRITMSGAIESVSGTELVVGDRVIVVAGEVIPGDGDVVEGIASVDESAITGESAPVVRESGGDRCAVTGGTTVLSDRIVVEITAAPGSSFVDRMIALVEGASRQKTPNEIALNILLASLTVIFLLAVVAIGPMGLYAGHEQDPIKLIALLVCLIPTTIGALLSAIGIAGMDRLVQRNVLAMSGRAVEAAGDIDTLLMDKTGTITFGNRRATALHPAPGVSADDLAAAARLSSLADGTPEGRSIVELCAAEFGLAAEPTLDEERAEFVPFTAQTRMSGLDHSGRQIRKGAADAVMNWVVSGGGHAESAVTDTVNDIAQAGGTPLVVAVKHGESTSILGVIALSDVVKPGMADRFAELRAMGIRTIMITGDNPLTAKAIADEAGVDDFMAEATPEDKLALIRKEQEGGRLVAMTGDGTNDAPAPCPGGCRGRDEHGNLGSQRGREHGRSRFRSHQADRGGGNRQAIADHPRRVDHILVGERPGEVFRNPAGLVQRYLPAAGRVEHHASRHPRIGDRLGRDLQRLGDHRFDSVGTQGCSIPTVDGIAVART